MGEELVVEDWVVKVGKWGMGRFYLRLLTRDLDTEFVVCFIPSFSKWMVLPGDPERVPPSQTAIDTAMEWMKNAPDAN